MGKIAYATNTRQIFREATTGDLIVVAGNPRHTTHNKNVKNWTPHDNDKVGWK